MAGELPPEDPSLEFHLPLEIGAAVIAHIAADATRRHSPGAEGQRAYVQDALTTIQNHTGMAPEDVDQEEVARLIRNYVTFPED
jgi:hypothetical protein